MHFLRRLELQKIPVEWLNEKFSIDCSLTVLPEVFKILNIKDYK